MCNKTDRLKLNWKIFCTCWWLGFFVEYLEHKYTGYTLLCARCSHLLSLWRSGYSDTGRCRNEWAFAAEIEKGQMVVSWEYRALHWDDTAHIKARCERKKSQGFQAWAFHNTTTTILVSSCCDCCDPFWLGNLIFGYVDIMTVKCMAIFDLF